MAERLMLSRHLTKAYREMNAAKPQDKATAAVCKRVGMLADEAQSAATLLLQRLDVSRRALATALFVQAAPLQQVALDLDIDTDLLDVKLCKIYEALAEACR